MAVLEDRTMFVSRDVMESFLLSMPGYVVQLSRWFALTWPVQGGAH